MSEGIIARAEISPLYTLKKINGFRNRLLRVENIDKDLVNIFINGIKNITILDSYSMRCLNAFSLIFKDFNYISDKNNLLNNYIDFNENILSLTPLKFKETIGYMDNMYFRRFILYYSFLKEKEISYLKESYNWNISEYLITIFDRLKSYESNDFTSPYIKAYQQIYHVYGVEIDDQIMEFLFQSGLIFLIEKSGERYSLYNELLNSKMDNLLTKNDKNTPSHGEWGSCFYILLGS